MSIERRFFNKSKFHVADVVYFGMVLVSLFGLTYGFLRH
jgi:hypothetical protein